MFSYRSPKNLPPKLFHKIILPFVLAAAGVALEQIMDRLGLSDDHIIKLPKTFTSISQKK